MNTDDKLQTKENLFHSMSDVMADVSPAMIWMTDAEGNCNFVNPAWLDFTGVTLEQAFDQNEWKRFIHPADQKLFEAYYSGLNSEDKITLEYRLRHADGSWRWVLDIGVPVFDSAHKFCGYMGSAIEITEPKKKDSINSGNTETAETKNNTLTTEERFRIMATVSPAMIWMTDENRHCSFVNQTWLDFTGLTLEQAQHQATWAKLIHPDDTQLFSAYYSDLDSEHTITVEYRLRHADGEWHWVLDRAVPVFNDAHVFCGYMGSAIDITEQKKSEKALQRSEANMRAIVETAATTIITIDAKGIIQSANPAVERLFHYKPHEIIGLNINVLMPEPFHSEHDGYMSRYLNGGKAQIIGGFGREVTGLRKNGSTFPAHLAISEVTFDGERRFVGVLSDMTEQKMNEEMLLNYSENLEELVAIQTAEVRAIVQTAINGIVTINAQGLIDEFNPAAELMFGYKKHEVSGKNVTVLMPEPYHSEHDSYLHNFLTTGVKKIIGIGREVIAQRKDGSQFPMYLAVGHTVLLSGRHIFVGFLSDITEQKNNEKRLAEAKEAAEAGARSKAAFIANMSHEIRTPMNAILGFSEVVLQDSKLSLHSLKNVRTIHNAAKSLLGIINDVLDVSKMESGKFTLESVCFNLYNVLSDSIHTLESKAAEKGLTLNFDYAPELPIRVMGDPTRLRQVILNLVGNAIKFTENGTVKLVVKADEKANRLHFSVIDTGIGMTDEQVKMVFDAFSQADASTTRRFGGTGLGTSISKQIIESMHGEIWVESIFGEGSTFHFTVYLPVATNIQDSLYEDSSFVSSNYISPRLFNILLAEDIEANATLATLRLEQQGHHIQWVKNGRETVNAFKNGTYDVILMDVQMPELDGLGATREIRALESSAENGTRTTILALTASVLNEEKKNCFDAGMDGVIGKPIEFCELFSTMEKTIPENRGKHRTDSAPTMTKNLPFDFGALAGHVDYEKGLKIWLNSVAYNKALVSFAAEHRNDADKMLANADNTEAVRHIAHALKGVAGNLAIPNVARLAGEIERLLGSAEKEALKLLPRLGDELQRVAAAIDSLKLSPPQITPTREFDENAVSNLFVELFAALEELSPDAVEPVLLKLADYLDGKILASLQDALDHFDFDDATHQAQLLAQKLELSLN